MASFATPLLYFENAAGRLLEHPAGYAHLRWKSGPRALGDLQALLNHLDRLLRRHRWSRVLADQTLLAPFTPAEHAWIINDWLPRAGGEGPYRYGAVVVAHDVFARLASNNVVAESRVKAVTYRMFGEEQEAAAWLLQVR